VEDSCCGSPPPIHHCWRNSWVVPGGKDDDTGSSAGKDVYDVQVHVDTISPGPLSTLPDSFFEYGTLEVGETVTGKNDTITVTLLTVEEDTAKVKVDIVLDMSHEGFGVCRKTWTMEVMLDSGDYSPYTYQQGCHWGLGIQNISWLRPRARVSKA